MDPVLVMDDIIEKLHLLDYVKKFCHLKGKVPISRTYFAMPLPNLGSQEASEIQVRYFFELSYWLINLADEIVTVKGQRKPVSKPTSAKKTVANYDAFPSKEDAL